MIIGIVIEKQGCVNPLHHALPLAVMLNLIQHLLFARVDKRQTRHSRAGGNPNAIVVLFPPSRSLVSAGRRTALSFLLIEKKQKIKAWTFSCKNLRKAY